MSEFEKALQWLRDRGHDVVEDDLIPGLYRIDGGPELTRGQLVHVVSQQEQS